MKLNLLVGYSNLFINCSIRVGISISNFPQSWYENCIFYSLLVLGEIKIHRNSQFIHAPYDSYSTLYLYDTDQAQMVSNEKVNHNVRNIRLMHNSGYVLKLPLAVYFLARPNFLVSLLALPDFSISPCLFAYI